MRGCGEKLVKSDWAESNFDLVGGPLDDLIYGWSRADEVRGLGGNDIIFGRAGSDLLLGGWGRDELHGGPGADVIGARDAEVDRISCGPGLDRVVADRRDRIARDCERVSRS